LKTREAGSYKTAAYLISLFTFERWGVKVNTHMLSASTTTVILKTKSNALARRP